MHATCRLSALSAPPTVACYDLSADALPMRRVAAVCSLPLVPIAILTGVAAVSVTVGLELRLMVRAAWRGPRTRLAARQAGVQTHQSDPLSGFKQPVPTRGTLVRGGTPFRAFRTGDPPPHVESWAAAHGVAAALDPLERVPKEWNAGRRRRELRRRVFWLAAIAIPMRRQCR